MIHTNCLKKLTALCECLAALYQLVMDETHLEWITEGWTVLSPKDPQKV